MHFVGGCGRSFHLPWITSSPISLPLTQAAWESILKLGANPSVDPLLTNPSVDPLLTNPSVDCLLTNPSVDRLLRNPSVDRLLTNPSALFPSLRRFLAEALRRPNFQP